MCNESDVLSSLIEGPPLSLRAMKKLFTNDPNLKEALIAEAEAFADLWNYNDLKEGITAFNERRKPEFIGT